MIISQRELLNIDKATEILLRKIDRWRPTIFRTQNSLYQRDTKRESEWNNDRSILKQMIEQSRQRLSQLPELHRRIEVRGLKRKRIDGLINYKDKIARQTIETFKYADKITRKYDL
tara:strand:- start:3764 stop:4111 length:348 start_codon:yes stop_codon:yes gene_type:complete